MKKETHPEYVVATVTCGCGSTFVTRSTKAEIHVEICSKCNPFYTGKQRLVDSAGQVEKFRRRYGLKVPTDTDAADEEQPVTVEEAQEPSADNK